MTEEEKEKKRQQAKEQARRWIQGKDGATKPMFEVEELEGAKPLQKRMTAP